MAKIGNFFAATTEPIDMACAKCGKGKSCKSPHTSYIGKGGKNILIIIDIVDDRADAAKNLAEGQAYKFLMTELQKHRINIYKDCWVVPSVRCNTKELPTKADALACRYKLIEDIEELQPKYIWTFGNLALGAITNPMYSGIQDISCHGDVIPLQEFKAFLLPFFATFMIQKNKKDANFQSVFKRNIKKAVQFVKDDLEFPTYDYTKSTNVEFLLKSEEIMNLFHNLTARGGEYTIDFECTGLKPHADMHKITTVGIANDEQAWSFPLDYQLYWKDDEWNQVVDALADFIDNPRITLIAHNKNFETMWSTVLLETTKNIDHCTQISQHIIDHRRSTKSLKYQAFIRWGLHSYEKGTKRYIESSTANGFNKMDEQPLPEQLLYVGLDAFLTMKLHREQQEEMKIGKLKQANKFFQESADAMVEMQLEGMAIDIDYYKSLEKELGNKIKTLEKLISEDEEVKKFTRLYRKQFDPSKDDVKKLLFDQMGLVPSKETDGGNKSIDQEVLKDFNLPICNNILELRKFSKLKDTYLAQFMREEVNGLVHPFFNLGATVSYRSGSSLPNDQNIPKRDKYSKIAIRTGMVPREGNQIAEIDFSGMEVSTGATYHKDPNMIRYLTTPGTDMHRDGAQDIWMLPGDEITDMIRFYVKNGWTFPQFYGDWYQSCAATLWKTSLEERTMSGELLSEHLAEQHIHSLEEFTEHCKTAEDILWKKRFKVYTQWKKDINQFYLDNGYIETHFGFRYTGLMDRKQTANYPIQGTAFHLLLVTINILRRRKVQYGWQSKIIGQVHDSCKLDLVPEESQDVLMEFKHIAEVELPKMFSFINVPLSVDAEISEINGSFAVMNKIKLAT